MSTSLLYHAFGITGNYKYQATHYDKGTIVFKIIPTKPYRCPCCNSSAVIKRGTRLRRFQTVPIGKKACFIELKVQRLACQTCKKLRFISPCFAPRHCRYTHAFKRLVLSLSSSMTIKALAGHLNTGWDLVKDIQKNTSENAIDYPH